MQSLGQNLQNLYNFKDSRLTREQQLVACENRYNYLKGELHKLKRQGKADMEHMKRKLKEQHDLNLQALKDKA